MPLNEEDVSRIMSRLDLPVEEFTKPLSETGGVFELANSPETDACVFLETDSKDVSALGVCWIYEFRPTGCRTYPVVLDMNDRVFKDDLCPWIRGFPEATDEQRQLLLELEASIKQESERRAQGDD